MKAQLLYYYIPKSSECPNPSNVLHHRGIRVDDGGSVWVIPVDRIPWQTLDHMSSFPEVVWNLMPPFDPNESEALLKIVTDAFTKYVRWVESQARESMDTAGDALHEADAAAEDAAGQDKARKAYLKRSKGALAKAERRLKAAQEAARGFGISAANLPVASAAKAVEGMRSAAEARARLYVEAAALVKDGSLAAAAAAGEVPGAILGDVLEDQGDAERADELRVAFADQQ